MIIRYLSKLGRYKQRSPCQTFSGLVKLLNMLKKSFNPILVLILVRLHARKSRLLYMHGNKI
jgi:hypothetical protein